MVLMMLQCRLCGVHRSWFEREVRLLRSLQLVWRCMACFEREECLLRSLRLALCCMVWIEREECLLRSPQPVRRHLTMPMTWRVARMPLVASYPCFWVESGPTSRCHRV